MLLYKSISLKSPDEKAIFTKEKVLKLLRKLIEEIIQGKHPKLSELIKIINTHKIPLTQLGPTIIQALTTKTKLDFTIHVKRTLQFTIHVKRAKEKI